MASCQMCFCDFDLGDESIICDNNHLFCIECINHYFTSIVNDKIIIDYFDKHEYIKCVLCDYCINEDSLLNSTIKKNYIKTARNISNTIVAKKTEISLIKSNSNFSNTLIIEIKDILTKCISCPYCKQPFIDFSGCLSLICAFCSKEFCGFCLKIHHGNHDGHDNVKSHIKLLSNTDRKYYGVHSDYFISNTGWTKLSDKIKTNAILDYLSHIRIDVVWKSIYDIIKILKRESLLSIENINILEEKIYSHNINGVHLLRIPIVFWTIYSSKHNIKIEKVIETIEITIENRIAIGKYVIDRVRNNYPNWKAIKHQIPGEDFSAVNYPPELSPIIFSAVSEWGVINKHWL